MLYLSTRCSRRRVIVLPLSRFAPPSPPTIVGKRHKKQHRQEALKKKQHRSNNSKFALSQREIPSKSMFDHPSSLQIQGAYSCILYSIFKAKCKKTKFACPMAKNQHSKLEKQHRCVCAVCALFQLCPQPEAE